ncbi:MAG: hypothetical protein PHV16_05415 [Candidatus Nanoarchaeia archaeon]|nr:hypothetical protein [Candidatus Nanoarchaeia archaeon]
MDRKIKLFFKLSFVSGIIILFILLFAPNAIAGSDFNVPIYIQTSAGVEKANYDDLVEILFNHDFSIEKRGEVVSDESCSLNAEGGNLEIDGKSFDKNYLSFYIPLKNSAPGEGSLTAQKNRDRFSLSFDIEEILETNSERLIFRASGKGILNQKELIFDEIIVSFDKIDNIAGIIGTGDKDFEASGLKASSVKGCLSADHDFYFLIDNGELGKGRSSEEVVKILKDYPEFMDIYWNLEKIHKPYWWIHIPNGNPGSIWTTKNDCGDYGQDVNQYSIGEYVYVNGENFKPGDYDWAITGKPGQASCDPDTAVAIGSLTVDNSGAFCFNAYQIQQDDCKEYKVEFSNKNDNYMVVPEFNTFIGILTLAGAAGIFFFVRKR